MYENDPQARELRLLRPAWAEINRGAIAENLAVARSLVRDGVKVYFVCKGDGFGFGAATVARLAADAGVDGFCVGSPEEGAAIRAAGINHEVLLFASTLPEDAARVASLGLTVTIQSMESLHAFVCAGVAVDAFVEIDPGFGRFGFLPSQWREAFRILAAQSVVRLKGVYTHLSSPGDDIVTGRQAGVFDAALADARAAGFDDVTTMLASSRVMISHPELSYRAVDPGRLLYGALDREWMERVPLRPMLRAVRARIIHVQQHPAGSMLGIGYAAPIRLERAMRVGVVPIGFGDGLNHVPPLGRVLVCGAQAQVLGRRSLQHTVIDLTDLPDAGIGSVVTLVGEDGGQRITIDELADTLKLPVMELLPRLVRSLPQIGLS
ncbi:alanine racemase [Burkholderia cepacia]|uniref:alanine racemase n=1 Tax=Burkholderia cepacia TaxID=292 RepID=UPI000753D3C2|nr:alanine racemase [Burkholderia cepacia]KVS61698.1 alanine racemase [Burkholderia cepacia]KWF87719.1 alanine racemase [Burkholderia cepacia]